jgi:hypothetical protein
VDKICTFVFSETAAELKISQIQLKMKSYPLPRYLRSIGIAAVKFKVLQSSSYLICGSSGSSDFEK